MIKNMQRTKNLEKMLYEEGDLIIHGQQKASDPLPSQVSQSAFLRQIKMRSVIYEKKHGRGNIS